MLDYEQLEDVLEAIRQKVILANRMGELERLLQQWGLADILMPVSVYDTDKNGIILVIGETDVPKEKLIGVAKELGLDADRFEFCLGYDRAKTYKYSKLQYNPNYRLVLFGPVPHSSKGKHDSSSVIAEMQSHEGYPRVEILNANNALKITKSNFEKTLRTLIESDFISCA